MSNYDVYVLVLCLIVFVMLVGAFSFLISALFKLTTKLVRSGSIDTEIKKEYDEMTAQKSRAGVIIEKIISGVLCAIILGVFAFSLYANCSEGLQGSLPSIRVVKSSSMSEKHGKNTYLVRNKLDDQIQTFDLILTYALPAEDELALYDIVVYEVSGDLIVHRIVGIEKPNSTHPDETWFLLQGDAVEKADRFPVRYSQMRAIYRGERMPFIGSFVMFMQSPAGWICAILVVFVMILLPILENKINGIKINRLVEAGLVSEDEIKTKGKAKKDEKID